MIYLRPAIYFDVTDLLDYALDNSSLSGIQRMSTMMLNRIVNMHGAEAVRLLAYDRSSDQVRWFPADCFGGVFDFDQRTFVASFGMVPHRGPTLQAYLRSKYKAGWKRMLHGSRLRLSNWLDHGESFARRNIERDAPVLPLPKPGPQGQAYEARPGDVIFVPGATWHFPEFLPHLRRARARGVRVIQFVHDLIPIVAHEHYVGWPSAQFASWFESMLEIASTVFVNSQATARDVSRFVGGRKGKAPTIHVLPLAHQYQCIERPGGRALSRAATGMASPVSATRQRIAERPYVLAVGTLDTRKNLLRLVRVWLQLRQERRGAMPVLVLAGKQGHGWDQVLAVLRKERGLKGDVVVIERPDDDELADLYRNCLFTAFASHYEGWGLPVGESLWFGKPVVASRSSAIPEVGGHLADYFDPASDAQMKSALERMIFDAAHRHDRVASILRAPLRSWDDVSADLWAALGAFMRAEADIDRNTAA